MASKYIESNLGRDEQIMEIAQIHKAAIIPQVLKCLTIVGIPSGIVSIIRLLGFIELGFTNKKVIGKVGIINTKRLDAPLNKVDNVSVSSGLFGKIFGYGTIVVSSTSSKFEFAYIKSPEVFRTKIMDQVEQFDQDRIKKQAQEMAQAMKQ